nr:uncharacterized protein LOC128704738 [Cherax quadricarinatus]
MRWHNLEDVIGDGIHSTVRHSSTTVSGYKGHLPFFVTYELVMNSGGVERTSPGRLSFGDGEVLGLTPSGGSPGSLKVPGALAASSGGLGRIARLLVKDATRSGEDAYRRRTHSLESKNGAAPLRRAASIDSIVDTNAINTASNNGINSKSSVLSMTKSNGHLRAYLPVSPALYKRSSFKFDRVASSELYNDLTELYNDLTELYNDLTDMKALQEYKTTEMTRPYRDDKDLTKMTIPYKVYNDLFKEYNDLSKIYNDLKKEQRPFRDAQ